MTISRSFLTILALTLGATTQGLSQIVTYQFTGSVPQYFSTLPAFPEYSPFTVTLNIDYSIPKTSFAANKARWFGAVDLTLNFANGAYIGTADNLDLWMQGTNAYVSLDRGASTVLNFPDVQGLSVSPTSVLPYFGNFQDFGANFSGAPSLSVLDFDPFVGQYAYFKLNFGPDSNHNFSGTLDTVTTVIPESSTYALCLGLVGLAAVVYRRRRRLAC